MQRRVSLCVVAVTSVLLMGLVSPAQAQNRALPGQAGSPATTNAMLIAPAIFSPGGLSTGYVNSSGWASGPYINVTTAGGSGVTITSVDMYFKGTANRNVSVYWKVGSYVGSETTAGAWTLLGTVNVTPGGDGTLTPVALGGIGIPAGQTVGLHVWDGGTGDTNGPGLDLRSGGTNTSDGTIGIVSNHYTSSSIFSGLLSGFGWQGNVNYTLSVPTMGIGTMAVLFALVSGIALMALRRRSPFGSNPANVS